MGTVRELPKPAEIRPTNLPTLDDLKNGRSPHEWDGLRALGRYIICMRIDVGKSVTSGGIVIPDNAQMPAWVAVAVGSDVTIPVKVWDRVLMIFKQPDVVCIDHDGRQFMLIPQELACCILPMPDPDAAPRIVTPNGVYLNGEMQ